MALLEELRASIYEEHADEASFLHEQRVRWLEDPALSFDDIAALEERREAHLDGLYLGGATALQLVAARACAGEDAGIVDTALRIACRHMRSDTCQEIVSAVCATEVMTGARDALCTELPSEMTRLAAQALRSEHALLMAFWARVVGYRRLPLAAELRAPQALGGAEPAQLVDVVWACGELGEPCPVSFREALSTGSAALTQAVVLATLKAGSLSRADLDALDQAHPGWAAVPAALAGAARYEQLARQMRAADGDGREQAIVALGLLGDVQASSLLLELLADAEAARPAAVALQLLTCATLLETVELAEPEDPGLDPDLVDPEDDDEEPERAARASTETRLCQDAARWAAWFAEHPRADKPHTLQALANTALPLRARSWLADGLRIQNKHNVAFQPDMPITRQRGALRSLEALLTQRPGSAASGWS